MISDRIDLKTKTVIRDKEGHDIMIKGSNQHVAIMFVNIYASNIVSPTYIKVY